MVCVCTITDILKSQCPILYTIFYVYVSAYFDVRYTLVTRYLHPILYFMYTSVPTLTLVCEQKKCVQYLAF
jgi:hypothetical protein